MHFLQQQYCDIYRDQVTASEFYMAENLINIAISMLLWLFVVLGFLFLFCFSDAFFAKSVTAAADRATKVDSFLAYLMQTKPERGLRILLDTVGVSYALHSYVYTM